jgi:tRNA U54 and U55 pseudouridine synthase Pus10
MHVCLLTSAGTYIKEFVHGDLGRTVPSVGSLLDSEADILQLDVTNVYDSLQSVANKTDEELFEIEVLGD